MSISFGKIKGVQVKVSIIMSTIDNRAELLERSLWTYMKQDYSPLEVIVVADRPNLPERKRWLQTIKIG